MRTGKLLAIGLLVVVVVVLAVTLVAFVVSIIRTVVELAVIVGLGWLVWHLMRREGPKTSG